MSWVGGAFDFDVDQQFGVVKREHQHLFQGGDFLSFAKFELEELLVGHLPDEVFRAVEFGKLAVRATVNDDWHIVRGEPNLNEYSKSS